MSDPNAPFIMAAFAVASAVVASMAGSIALDHWRLRAALARLERERREDA